MAKRSTRISGAGLARNYAVIYARVSSKEQEKEGFSIPAQLKLLKEYAATHGFPVAQEYVDVETAKQTGRTAFGAMVAYLKSHPAVGVLLVEKTDRLYRNLKDWVTVDELDIEIHFPKEGIVLSLRHAPAKQKPGKPISLIDCAETVRPCWHHVCADRKIRDATSPRALRPA
jgi:site-specific DNA recombinase